MRGLKRQGTKILTAYQICYNYLRLHEGLNGGTPTEASGSKLNVKKIWITLIQNAK